MSETGAVFSDACITPEDATIARCTACGSQLVEAAALALGMVCPDAFVYTNQLVAMAEQVHADTEHIQRMERRNKVQDLVQVPRAYTHTRIHARDV